VSDDKISLEWLGSRVLTLTAELRDLQLRFGALEQRFTALEARLGGIEARLGSLESRFGAQEERMSAMLSVLVRLAERIDGGAR
jgi:uncharacterized coiled-coil protein SlyX